jgi:DNA repair protein RecN (Recombination protein N)
MLTELHIEDFAIIDQLDLQFGPGLVVFTGETGAGKSIIIDAVETLLGGRAESTYVRSGSERAIIDAVFHIPEAARTEILAILEREDLLDEPTYLTMGREIRLSGRNVARVNGRNVNASLLRELGEYLIDLHGQSEHLSLLRVNQHLSLLDSFALAANEMFADGPSNFTPDEVKTGQAPASKRSIHELLSAYEKTYQRLQVVRRELEQLRKAERDASRRSDMLAYQINEIESARLRIDEEEELRDERNRLANAEGLASLTQEALMALDEGNPEALAVTDLFGQVVHALSSLSRLDPSQSSLLDQAQSLSEGLSDLALNLRAYLEGIEFNPKRLDHVEERLALLHGLKRKYGDSVTEILKFLEQAHQQLDEITHAGERIQELEDEQEKLLTQLGQEGMALSRERQAAGERLSQAMEIELADLFMSGAQFKVDFQQRSDPQGVLLGNGHKVAFDAHGLERVEFLIAPNPGEGFKPLAKIASGGETSRLMLALKNVLARADQIPTLIFDEIDQGIGGRVGAVVGQKLWSLARQHQVLCITHLPQLAVYGEQHFQVQKVIHEDRTTTQVTKLDEEKRLIELAQMLGEVSEGTLHSARELMQTVGSRTSLP